LERSLDGDKNPHWKGWYDPAKRRQNDGFPAQKCWRRYNKNLKQLCDSFFFKTEDYITIIYRFISFLLLSDSNK
jgi:hypothetical protein